MSAALSLWWVTSCPFFARRVAYTLFGSKIIITRYDTSDTIISGAKRKYPPVSSAMRNMLVSGACITALIMPAIPRRA